ncbi:MAG TPA: ABC transporter ATP-binding protein [Mucilaginibacter sp.]|jgi:ABC-2 type transport system ATP-binding protein|nr:ABC transporter ATP-binding protein [Mucilaginibacter sp.]
MDTQLTNILQVDDLNVFYDSFQAVKDVSFHVKQGEIFGLLGPNGAGKTSTLSAVEGLIKQQSGTVTVAGYDTLKHPLHAKAAMGVQLQATSFQPELNVSEILELYASLYGLDLTREKLQKLLKEINLAEAENKRFGQLSGGQQQRVSLAITTIHDPKLVLLDEPTSGLDPQSRRRLWSRIDAIREKGHGVVLTTHSMEEAEAVCDRISIIDHGRIIETDTPQALIDKHRDDLAVIAVSRRGKVTLEDVFIALTGLDIRG